MHNTFVITYVQVESWLLVGQKTPGDRGRLGEHFFFVQHSSILPYKGARAGLRQKVAGILDRLSLDKGVGVFYPLLRSFWQNRSATLYFQKF